MEQQQQQRGPVVDMASMMAASPVHHHHHHHQQDSTSTTTTIYTLPPGQQFSPHVQLAGAEGSLVYTLPGQLAGGGPVQIATLQVPVLYKLILPFTRIFIHNFFYLINPLFSYPILFLAQSDENFVVVVPNPDQK